MNKNLILVLLPALFYCGPALALEDQHAPSAVSAKQEIPYFSTVMDLIGSLEYSGLYALMRADVTLSIDFNRGEWTLHGIRQYDEKGGVLLDRGRYGLCAELSSYVYEKIKPLFSDNYEIRFGNVRERGFFVEDLSNHVVLLIRDKVSHREFLIDPSFQKYGKVQDFPEYNVLGVNDSLAFLQQQFQDVTYKVNQGMPLYIKNDALISFSMESVDGKFDKDNFFFVLSLDHRFKGPTSRLVLFGKHGGEDKMIVNESLAKYVKPDDFLRLYGQIHKWFKAIERGSDG